MSKTLPELRTELEKISRDGSSVQFDRFFTEEILDHIPKCCEISDEYIFLMNEAGAYYRSVSQFDNSISAFTTLMRNMERFEMDSTAAYATVVNNLAGSFRMAGDYKQAEELFQQSLAIYEALGAEDSFGYASALNNLSICYQATRNYEKALDYQERAIACAKKQGMSPAVEAASYTNLANIYSALKWDENAAEAIGKAISIFEGESLTGDSSYITALHTQACFYYGKKEFKKAVAGYRRALGLIEAKFGRNADYSTVARNLAVALHDSANRKQAVSILEQAAAVDLSLFGGDSERYAAVGALLDKYQLEEAASE